MDTFIFRNTLPRMKKNKKTKPNTNQLSMIVLKSHI